MVKGGKPNLHDEKYAGVAKISSSYFLYCNENRQNVMATLREELGDKFRIYDVTKKLSADWKIVSEEKKAEYQTKFEAAKAEYMVKHAEWAKTPGYKAYCIDKSKYVKTKKSKLADKKAKAAGKPLKPKAGFGLFGDSIRQDVMATIRNDLKEGEKFKVTLVGKTIADQWKALGEEEKAEWKVKAAAAKIDQKKIIAEWKISEAGTAYEKEMKKIAASYQAVVDSFKKRKGKKEALDPEAVLADIEGDDDMEDDEGETEDAEEEEGEEADA